MNSNLRQKKNNSKIIKFTEYLRHFLVVQCLFDTFLMGKKKSLEKIPTEGIVDPLVIFIAPISLSSVSF